MPAIEFFAAPSDERSVLDLIFAIDGARVFEAYSASDQPIREYFSPSDVPQTPHLSVFLDGTGPEPIVRRIDYADPLPGQTHRFTLDGWGLIQVLFARALSPTQPGLARIAHNTAKRAAAWEATYPEFGPASAWDFPAITRVSRRLGTAIRALAVPNEAHYPVLPHADAMMRAAITP